MNFDLKLKDEIEKGDFRHEDEDSYVKMVKADSKKSLIIKIGMGTLYVSLLIGSLFLV